MDFIDNRGRKEDLNTTIDGASDEKTVQVGAHVKLSKKVNTNPETVKKQKKVLSRKCHTNNPFKPEEDQILLEEMCSGEKLDFNQLAKKMNRTSASVKNRVNKLKMTGVSTKTKMCTRFRKILLFWIQPLKTFSNLPS